jgi:hypothetical protein
VKHICVYCGSSPGVLPEFAEVARSLGASLARRGIGLVYGGANRGTMGMLADAALAEGGEVLGVIPHGLVAFEVAHPGLTRLEIVETLHERKARMTELCDAFICLPGGHGTHDELFEALTWLQLGIHHKPIGVVNVRGFYDHLLRHLDHSREMGFIRPEHRAMLLADPDHEALIQRLVEFEPPQRPEWHAAARP